MTIHENASDLLRQYRDVLRGHDHVHPDELARAIQRACTQLDEGTEP